MLARESLRGLRVVASPQALDAATWDGESVVLRFAPDDAFAIGATGIEITDEHAIAVEETGWVGYWLTPDDVAERVVPHIEWSLPAARPALAQGFIAGVPAKLWLAEDRCLVLCAVPYEHELAQRLR